MTDTNNVSPWDSAFPPSETDGRDEILALTARQHMLKAAEILTTGFPDTDSQADKALRHSLAQTELLWSLVKRADQDYRERRKNV